MSKTRYELEFEDTFDADVLDGRRWVPHYLPQWSSRGRSAARYEVGGGRLLPPYLGTGGIYMIRFPLMRPGVLPRPE